MRPPWHSACTMTESWWRSGGMVRAYRPAVDTTKNKERENSPAAPPSLPIHPVLFPPHQLAVYHLATVGYELRIGSLRGDKGGTSIVCGSLEERVGFGRSRDGSLATSPNVQ